MFSTLACRHAQTRPPSKPEGLAPVLAQHEFETASKWTRGIDIFAKDFLMIPMCRSLHWSVAVVCFPGVDTQAVPCSRRNGLSVPCILHFNSIHAVDRHVFKRIRQYIQYEWDTKKASTSGDRFPDAQH